jgi:alkylhydroperoxidase family enzyme
VQAVLADFRTAPISDAEKILFAFVEKVNHDSPSVNENDIQALHEAGWSDEAVYDAIMVCGLFNFYNRWVDASGVHEMSEAGHRASGKRLAARGYLMQTEPAESP